MKNRFSVRRIAALSVLCAGALVAFAIENLFPSFIVPGGKIGVSNVFVMLVLIVLGNAEAFVLVIVKSTLGCLIVGNMGALMYSLTGGVAACVVSVVLVSVFKKAFSLTAVCVISAVVNNLVQYAVFYLVTKSTATATYLPYLLLTGGASGAVVGIAVTLVIKKIPTTYFERMSSLKKEDRVGTEKR